MVHANSPASVQVTWLKRSAWPCQVIFCAPRALVTCDTYLPRDRPVFPTKNKLIYPVEFTPRLNFSGNWPTRRKETPILQLRESVFIWLIQFLTIISGYKRNQTTNWLIVVDKSQNKILLVYSAPVYSFICFSRNFRYFQSYEFMISRVNEYVKPWKILIIRLALCTMHYALCTKHYALSTMHYALCTMHYALCTMLALCTMHYARTMHYALCTMH